MTTGDQLRLDTGFNLDNKKAMARAGRASIAENKPAIQAYNGLIANLEGQRMVVIDAIDFHLQGF